MRVIGFWIAIVVVSSGGCGGDPVATDAGSPDAAGDAGVAVTAPSIPWFDEGTSPAILTPCPEGWRTVEGDRGTSCDPYGSEGALDCPPGEAHFPGETACRPIGDPCPAGDFAPDLPTDGTVVYVMSSADAGGDGSLARPYATLGEAGFASITAGTTVALGKGTYEGVITPRGGVRVVGACAAETIVAGSPFPAAAVITVTSAGEPAVVRNVSIASPPQVGALVQSGRALRLEGVIVEGAASFGLRVIDAGSVVELVDSVVRGTRITPAGAFGIGVYVGDSGRLDATRVLFEANQGAGVGSGTGGEVFLTRCVVRDSWRPRGQAAFGISVLGGRLEATELLLIDNGWVAFAAGGAETVVQLTDVVVRDTHPSMPGGRYGRGIEVGDGAHLEATRLHVFDNQDIGVFVYEGSTAALRDAVIRDTRPSAAGIGGAGIVVNDGSRFDGAGLLLSGNHDFGIRVGFADTEVVLSDTWVHDTRRPEVAGASGMGIAVDEGAGLDASRLVVSDSHTVAIAGADEGTRLALRDVAVVGALSTEGERATGRGLQVSLAAELTAERVRIEQVAITGLTTGAANATVRDLLIAGVEPTACATTTCTDRVFGYGAAAQGGRLDLERFLIRDASSCGVFLAPLRGDGTLPEVDLRAGTVADSAIGACVQVDGYDLGRLSDDVEYRDNGSSLESTALPVPEVPGLE